MDISNLLLSGGASVAFGALALALVVFLAGAALAFQAFRSAGRSRAALLDAQAKLSAAGDLADEVRHLRAQVEHAVVHHNEAIANARSLHNDACAGAGGYPQSASGHDDDDDDDHHHKHHAADPVPAQALKGHDDDDDDDDHHKHHSLKGHDHDGDDDNHHHKKQHGLFRSRLRRPSDYGRR